MGPAENRFEGIPRRGGKEEEERCTSGKNLAPSFSLEGCRRRWCRGGWRRRQRAHRGINFLYGTSVYRGVDELRGVFMEWLDEELILRGTCRSM